ncbi:alpha-1,3-mannosyl-glycoprotein 4-beta-N-acetylglucosaminyltransferase A-like [Dendronephthya gigantea]|uniref:alpha-1,3-mannosyl-glycoprotein 4-beta-N-acetylglucosaminyltransferase A-like n=1 Tax=Dendronephthya gigantea TaxID=151771 RepID=UPI001069CCD4|nr:alpha-1,3-mannosyl-glycoprotein 4-beta-N-acetylglucosaminyltransferase A-like [Dendronephthya gigantea]
MGFTLRRNRIILATVLFLLPVIFLIITSDGGNRVLKTGVEVDPSIIERLKGLSMRLRLVESKNDEVAQNLISIRSSSSLHQYKSALRNNRTKIKDAEFLNNTQLTLPSIYNYMSHLLGSKNSLVPATQVSAGRHGVSLAFGVPTIKRDKASYVLNTIQSLITGISDEEKRDCILIVFIAEIEDKIFVSKLIKELKDRFHSYIRSGLIEIVVPPKEFYPDLNNLPKDVTFHDPPLRVKWRTKQNLDFSYLMMYAQQRARFYVQLEDDLIATPGYVSTIRTFALQQTENRWMILEFSSLGFIGKLFRTSDLPAIVEFFLMFHKDKPVDWLLDHILWVKVCSPDKDQAHCNREKAQLRIRFKPSLFQHVGKESSLPGKRQNLVDKDFKKAPLFQAHLNPKASVITTINVYQTHTIERAYTGQSFFWGHTPHKGDVVRFKFDEELYLEHFRINTGNVEHPGDIFSNASVEILTTESKLKREKLSHETPASDVEAQKTFVKGEFLPNDYIRVGKFVNGLADYAVPATIGKVSELLIRVNDHTGQNWVIISEIHIIKR